MKKEFAIIGNLKREPEKYMLLGTGFFIDNNGYFVTAGHVFRKNRNYICQFYICFPNENEHVDLIEIENYKFYSRKIYGDYERFKKEPRKRFDYQCGPEYFDVAVGKVNIAETNFYEFKIKRPFSWNKLNMPCFNINKNTCPSKKMELVNGQTNSEFIEFHNHGLKVKERLALARIPFLYETMEFKNIDLYNNCIEVHGQGTKGNSGAPVLDENKKVIGIYISGTLFNDLRAIHLARYVNKKSRRLRKILEKA
jgi:hypothetical protein